MAASDTLSPETIRRLKRRYETSDEKIAAIAAEEGLEGRDLLAMQRRFGWRTRAARGKTTRPRAKPAASKAKPPARKPKHAARTAKRASKAATKKAVREKPAGAAPPPGLVDVATLIARIRAQLEGALQAAQAQGADAAPDDTARLMHNLTRTLQMLRALEKDTGKDERRDDGADEPPLDLAELRRDLARKIDLLRQERDGA